MYFCNGVDLNRSSFNKICELVDVEKTGGNVTEFANKELRPTGDKYSFNPQQVEIYKSLLNFGLISAVRLGQGLVRIQLTQAGRDWVADYEALQIQEKMKQAARLEEKIEDRKIEHKHSYKLALFTAIVGYVLGLLTGISGLIQQLLTGLTQN